MSREHCPFHLALEAEAVETFRSGERTERARVTAILESDEAVGREGGASFLALHSDLPARAAIVILSLSPRASAPAHRVRPLRWPTVETHLSLVGASQNET